MRVRRRYGVLGSFAALAAAVVLAGPAWACSPTAEILYPGNSQTRPPVLAGAVITVEGVRFYGPDVSGPVEIMWNSMSGAPIASAAGVAFSVQVPIPSNAAPGTYYIDAVQRSLADNTVNGKSSVAIEVLAPPRVVTPPVVTPPGPTPPGPTPPGGTAPAPTPPGPTPPGAPAPGPTAPGPSLGGAPTLGPSPSGAGAGFQSGAPGPGSASVSGVPSALSGLGQIFGFGGTHGKQGSVLGALAATGTPGGPGHLAQASAPANPARAWTPKKSSAPAPSLFEPSTSSDARHGGGTPVAAGLVSLGLMAIIGIGVVVGQRRRLALASKTGPRPH